MDVDPITIARAQVALRQTISDYLFDSNTSMVDFGLRQKNGVIVENEPTIRVHVHRKLPPNALAAVGIRPVESEISGFSTDVLEGTYRLDLWWGGSSPVTTSFPAASSRSVRSEPMRGGISISDQYRYIYGTLGAKAIDRSTGVEMILSNWHVLAGTWSARPGQHIYQPGRGDGGTSSDSVATLAREAMSVNLDAAVATLHGSRSLINEQVDLGSITGTDRPALGMEVVKSGRRTGITYGRVTGVAGTTEPMDYGHVQRVIREVVTVDPLTSDEVSAGGDSGSIWCNKETMVAIGLHFAGGDSPERALAMDIQSVLTALNIQLDTRRTTGFSSAYRRQTLAAV
jgi:endonuclease G